jgi:hypothetical protein
MSMLLGLGLGLGNVQRSMADYFAQREQKKLRDLQVANTKIEGMKDLLGEDAYSSPEFLQLAEQAGTPIPTRPLATANASPFENPDDPMAQAFVANQNEGLAPVTGAVLPTHVRQARLTRQLQQQQQEMQMELLNGLLGRGTEAPAPATPTWNMLGGNAQQGMMPNVGAMAAPIKAGAEQQPPFMPGGPLGAPEPQKAGAGASRAPGGTILGIPRERALQGMGAKMLGIPDWVMNEPLEDVTNYDPATGQETVTKVPRSQAAGRTSVKAPPADMRQKGAQAGNILDQLSEAERLYKDEFVGPFASYGYRAEGLAPEFLRNQFPALKQDEQQTQFYNALSQATEERLRMLTGAAVAKEEWPRIKEMLPNQTDQPETFKAKMQSVKAYIGRLAQQYGGQAGAQAQPANLGGGGEAVSMEEFEAFRQKHNLTPEQALQILQQEGFTVGG